MGDAYFGIGQTFEVDQPDSAVVYYTRTITSYPQAISMRRPHCTSWAMSSGSAAISPQRVVYWNQILQGLPPVDRSGIRAGSSARQSLGTAGTSMANSAGEMPFLDHLEELRKRILFSLAAIVVGFGIGWWLTNAFQPDLGCGSADRAAHSGWQTDHPVRNRSVHDRAAVRVHLRGRARVAIRHLSAVAHFLSPALTPREKRAILPSLAIGFVLFLSGARDRPGCTSSARRWRGSLNFQAGSFNVMPTYSTYMTLVIHLLLGMGISAELPLVMILLALLGVTSYRMYSKVQSYAVLAAFVGGAILAPTPEVSMMILFTIPLLLLYEVGVLGAWIVERRKRRAARLAIGVLFFALC